MFTLLETVTDAVALTPPAEAVTVNGPPVALPAVKLPVVSMVPPPLTAQETGVAVYGLPNWSVAAVVTVGGAGPLGATTWSWSAAGTAEVPLGKATVTSTVPAEWAGVTAVIRVSELTVNELAATPPKETVVAPVKLLPVMVTD